MYTRTQQVHVEEQTWPWQTTMYIHTHIEGEDYRIKLGQSGETQL